MTTSSFCLLTHETIFSIQGIDSKKFLQGQLTCNLDYLSTEQSSLGACCTAKGRAVSSFRIIQRDSNHYLIVLDKNLADKQLIDFKKYAIFSKATFANNTDQWIRFGLNASPDLLTFLPISIPQKINQITQNTDYSLISVSKNRFELWAKVSHANTTETLLNEHLNKTTLNEWLLGQIRAGVGQVFLENSERFVPQMINLQSLGGVSFKKGCYIGQEIVARMQYLGKLKQHLYRFKLPSNQLPTMGAEIFSDTHNSSIGNVVLAAYSQPNEIELLAVARDDAIHNGVWLKESQNHQLELLTLPYEVNTDEEIKH